MISSPVGELPRLCERRTVEPLAVGHKKVTRGRALDCLERSGSASPGVLLVIKKKVAVLRQVRKDWVSNF